MNKKLEQRRDEMAEKYYHDLFVFYTDMDTSTFPHQRSFKKGCDAWHEAYVKPLVERIKKDCTCKSLLNCHACSFLRRLGVR